MLADGAEPGISEESAVRATQLIAIVTRRRIASSLRRLVAEAIRPHGALCSAVPLCRPAVASSREGLLGLAEVLEREQPVNPCGVARTLLMLRDGAGPLYDPGSPRSIRDMIWWIADGLQPCPPHEWGCPKVMKVDPDHVAWTCQRCGAIGMTSDPDIRPMWALGTGASGRTRRGETR